MDGALVSGHTVLYQLVIGECRAEAEKAYLLGFREAEQQSAPESAVLRALHHRKLIVPEGNGYRLRVPLMRHWLQTRMIG